MELCLFRWFNLSKYKMQVRSLDYKKSFFCINWFKNLVAQLIQEFMEVSVHQVVHVRILILVKMEDAGFL
jgi:hypothetical protein